MMEVYNSYQEAKIKNPESLIVTTASHWNGSPEIVGKFSALITGWNPKGAHVLDDKEGWVACDPVNYLPTLEWFFSEGHQLVGGDIWMDTDGEVKCIKSNMESNYYVNLNFNLKNRTIDELFGKKLVLHAAALEIPTETPEESEALSAIAQVDSEEWNGEGLPPVGVECNFTPDNTMWGFNYIESFTGVVLHYEGEQFVFMMKHEKYKLEDGMVIVSRTDKGEFSKPETPEQKAERERIENGKAIYDLMSSIEMNHDIAGTPNTWSELRDEWQSVYIQLAESVGFRKESK